MLEAADQIAPRTTTDMVFDALHEQIQTLKILPGTRISEAEVAANLGVSRQPVRDAFNRLSNLQLLRIRPQRATVVSGFSMPEIKNVRFIRLAIELEIARLACANWTPEHHQKLEANIERQRAAIAAIQIDRFHKLDYEFHQMICTLAGHPLAFKTLMQCKQKVERLCMLSLAREDEVSAVLVDHQDIAAALAEGSAEKVEKVFRRHLGRLDEAIIEIHEKHSEYFD
ncbi:GntR family transcriptional regulator [Poseidonocella sedimentorum]|uniref:DNA-binding transcriptional regulator, GntR family n=1 Tax=Poseidonocella sedimentorum TaxID=871652 RepID=A0A1I6DLZ0_9RHOB|nr:GntR family transcriptional regulator [Poseidonocella sedimentorum]SFR06475.1 DNA-binding transcriptional regulator, GntR family [Poseidonocella sedimentorum]